jgi:hypothetical protein
VVEFDVVDLSDSGWQWLKSTADLQRDTYGYDLPMPPGEKIANYAVMNHTAGVKEFGELLDEFGWKPWASPRGWFNREAALSEAVDVAHFLANILVAIGVTDEEWELAYRMKQEMNRRRQRAGYTGRDKCRSCGRAYDDPTTRCRLDSDYCQDAATHATRNTFA